MPCKCHHIFHFNLCYINSILFNFQFISVIKWVFNDFRLKHLIWIKFIFLFQSASMTVLYPYLNLHMKSLGLSIQEVAIINAVIPVSWLFRFNIYMFISPNIFFYQLNGLKIRYCLLYLHCITY